MTKRVELDVSNRRAVERLFANLRGWRGPCRARAAYDKAYQAESDLRDRLLDVPEMREAAAAREAACEEWLAVEKRVQERAEKLWRHFMVAGLTEAVKRKVEELVNEVNEL